MLRRLLRHALLAILDSASEF